MKRSYTFEEFLELLSTLEVIDLVELMEISSKDLVEAFADRLECGDFPRLNEYIREVELDWVYEDDEDEE